MGEACCENFDLATATSAIREEDQSMDGRQERSNLAAGRLEQARSVM